MNKIRNLLQKLFKKNQKTQDSSEDFDLDKTGEIPNFEAEGELQLDDNKPSLSDRFHTLKIKIADRFRKLRTKELSHGSVSSPKNSFTFFKKKTAHINWEKLPNNILSSEHHQRAHNYFQVAVIICLVYFMASLISHFMTGAPTYKATSKGNAINIDDNKLLTSAKINKIKNANIFKTTQVEAVKDDKRTDNANKKCETADRKSSLPIKLVNTIVLQDSVKSIASVSVRSNAKLESFRVGDNISSLAKIGKIDRLRLIIKNLSTGDCESIEGNLSPKQRGGAQLTVLTPKASRDYKKQLKKVEGIDTDGTNFKIKKEFLQEKLKNINDLLTQARGIKIDNPDGTMCFKIVDIEAGSAYDYLGIQNSDTICKIDGESINDLNTVMKMFGNIANVKNLSLGIRRNGEETSQTYKIE